MTFVSARHLVPVRCVRILCVGDEVDQLLEIQRELDSDYDFVIVACCEEGQGALAEEAPFDLIINDQRMSAAGGTELLARLRQHSPDAERLVLALRHDRATRAMAAEDGRIMRLLVQPCPAAVLREAVADALLRHRARALRASAIPRVTPAGGHPCCVSRSALVVHARSA
ncbi:MAG: response regulator [Gemmatimonadaceae bacterium]|nr:response regulator [Gemmatimonadaceae bacterium]